MTKHKTRSLIEYKVAKPFVDAAALGLAVGGPSSFAGNFWAGFVGGASFSLFWYWGKGNVDLVSPTKGPQRRGRNIPVNTHQGQRNLKFEQVAPGYITRQSALADFAGLFWKPPKPRTVAAPKPKPQWMKEFVFYSQGLELAEPDVIRFLNAAWRNRSLGQGLSKRRWVRRIKKRPQWYQDLGKEWYYAIMELLWDCERLSGRQIISPMSYQQIGLARPPHQTMEALRWAESAKGNVPEKSNIVDVSFDRGENSTIKVRHNE
jgi:hypothetical protein